MKTGSRRILGMVMLMAVVALMGMSAIGYGQPYEPEHLWGRAGTVDQANFGHAIDGVGDQNGDGIEDFMIATGGIPGDITTSFVELYFGGDPPDTIPDVLIERWADTVWCGEVANVGDVNGDGGIDIAVSQARSFIWNKVAIYYGGSAFDTIPDIILNEPSAQYSDLYGYNIEGLGDVNGDGYDDIAVRAPNYPNMQGRGKVWIYFGGSPMDTIADWEKVGSNQSVFFGESIAGKGDLNGDGFDDFAIYEWTGYPELAYTTYYIFLGDAQLDTIPDLIIDGEELYPQIDIENSSAIIANLNGDQYSDLIIAAASICIVFYGSESPDTELDLTLEGFQQISMWYGIDVASVGDVNNDGFDDIIAAQTQAYSYGGLVSVFLGNTWMDGQPAMQWIGIFQPYEGAGKSLGDCGDVNGDGVDDIMFGSYHFDFNSYGRVDIWKGDTAFVVNVPEQNPTLSPIRFQLLPPYPNPFNSRVTIPFDLYPGGGDDISLVIYNVLGQEVAELTDAVHDALSHQPLGRFTVTWDGINRFGRIASSGIYLIALRSGSTRQIQKVLLLR